MAYIITFFDEGVGTSHSAWAKSLSMGKKIGLAKTLLGGEVLRASVIGNSHMI